MNKQYIYKFSKSMSKLINTMLLVPSDKEPNFPNTPWKFFGKSWGLLCDELKYKDPDKIESVKIHFYEPHEDSENPLWFIMIVNFNTAGIPDKLNHLAESYFDEMIQQIYTHLPSSDELADEMTESIKACYLGVIE